MKGIIAIIIVAVLAAAGFYLARQPDCPSFEPVAVAPGDIFNLIFPDYNCQTVKLADFRGQNLVLNTWAAWCLFCKDELPDFAAAQKEFGDDVKIIAIDRAERLATAKRYSDELGVTGQLILLLDPEDSFYQTIGGFSMPETLFIDEQGNIVEHKRGPLKLPKIREKIKNLLEA